MSNAFEFILNSRTVRVAGSSPNTTLLDFLRASGLTGAQEGCAEGDCGACSVAVLDGAARRPAAWRAINSCLVPVALVAGREVITVEGVSPFLPLPSSPQPSPPSARGEGAESSSTPPVELHPVQQAMVRHHGSQCGYCTPGIILSLLEGY